jgi:glutamine synthetase
MHSKLIDVPELHADTHIGAEQLEKTVRDNGAEAVRNPATSRNGAMRSKFIEVHGLHSEAQLAAVEQSKQTIRDNGIEVVRLAWPDQHGLLRGKATSVEGYLSALTGGMDITMAPFGFDTANSPVKNPFTEDGGFAFEGMGGSPNIKMVPDPTTFLVLPWAPETAWVMCDLYMTNGQPFPYSPRGILKKMLQRLSDAGYGMVAGLEMEWYLARIVDDGLGPNADMGSPGHPAPPPVVAPVSRGYNYLHDSHLDEIDHVLRPLRKALASMGLPLRSFDDEWAPSQVETTFDILDALKTADAAVIFRMAAKQICRRQGHIASFMTKPAINGAYPSGWHLHTSVFDQKTGQNLMVPGDGEVLSELGRHYVGGVLEHAVAASVFTTPTITGYRRRQPFSLAPDRLTWALDNRAAMMRAISAPHDPSSHVENRVGDSAANPYLYIASQVAAGLDGIQRRVSPGPASENPYAEDVQILPTSLHEAADALEADSFYRDAFGSDFVDYMVGIKRHELSRYEGWLENNPDTTTWVNGVSEWEHREYFEMY